MNKKHGTQIALTYAHYFASSMKESFYKAYHFTLREIWYPLLENTMKLAELKFPKRKKIIDIFHGRKKRNARVRIIKWCCCLTKKWKIGNHNGMERNLAYYEQFKPTIDADKEYSDEHESDREILQYDSDEAKSDNEKSLNLGRKFETSIHI